MDEKGGLMTPEKAYARAIEDFVAAIARSLILVLTENQNAEREACAKLAEDFPAGEHGSMSDGSAVDQTSYEIAKAIRTQT